MVLTQACRTIQYRAYYRIKPASGRISGLALEAWHIGLGGSILISRIGQFLFAAIFWVGRIDVAFLSEVRRLLSPETVPHSDGNGFSFRPSLLFCPLLFRMLSFVVRENRTLPFEDERGRDLCLLLSCLSTRLRFRLRSTPLC